MTNNIGLPNEILQLILQQVTGQQHCTLRSWCYVNKQFHSIGNPLLWKELIVSTEIRSQRLLNGLSAAAQYRKQHYQQRPLSLSPGHHIQRLSIGGHHFTDDQLLHLLPHIPHLESLKLLFGTYITDTSIQQLPRYCPRLTTLELCDIPLTRFCFTALARHCRQLCQLELRHCDLAYPNMLQPITGHCPVEHLTIFDCPMDEQTIVADLIKFDRLKYFELTGVPSALMKSLIIAASTTITTTIYPWSQLNTFYFLNLFDVNNAIWLSFIKSHPHIQDITIRDAPLTDAIMIPVAQSLPKLKHFRLLDYSYITANGIRHLIRHGPLTLETIRCNDCYDIDAGDFTELPKRPSVDGHHYQVKLDITAINIIRSSTITSTNTITVNYIDDNNPYEP